MIVTDRTLSPERVTFHNTYAMGKGGYDAAVRIVTTGGETKVIEGEIHVSGAREVLMLMRIVPWKTPMPKERSEAWAYSPEHPDFSRRAGQFDPVPPLAESSVVPYLKDEDALALMPQLVKSLDAVQDGYDRLFAPHAKAHAALFERVTLVLGGEEDRQRTSADLFAEARETRHLSPALSAWTDAWPHWNHTYSDLDYWTAPAHGGLTRFALARHPGTKISLVMVDGSAKGTKVTSLQSYKWSTDYVTREWW
jgi:hypothetical protein